MKTLYSILMTLALPLTLLRLLWRSRHNRAYRQRLGERYALRFCTSQHAIWIHTVSVGEFLAAFPLIEKLLEDGESLLITTTTPTGSAILTEKVATFLESGQVTHQYLPFDAPFLVSRFLRKTQPRVAVFVETEIWANYLLKLHRKAIPALLINARLSDRSLRGYQKLGRFAKEAVGNFTEVACQDEASCQRFSQLGAAATVRGNLKFDLQQPDDLQARQTAIQSLIKSRDFILAASTHKGEEEILLHAYQQSGESRLLVIAPRHPERSTDIISLVKRKGLNTMKLSELSQTTKVTTQYTVLVIDTLGQLLPFYSLADYAIIGGSFVPHGGHNPLESALFATPCVMGEYYFNFESLINAMRAADAIQILTATQLFTQTPNPESGRHAQRFLSKNQGAIKNYQQLIMNNAQ